MDSMASASHPRPSRASLSSGPDRKAIGGSSLPDRHSGCRRADGSGGTARADGRPLVSPGSGSRSVSPPPATRTPAAGVEDVDRQKVIVIGIELAQFLFAMDPIEAFVEIQGEVVGDDRETVAIQVEHRHAIEFRDRKSTRLNSSHANISYAVFC